MLDSTSAANLSETFRAAYPMGSLISELLHVHDNQYVVRVQVQTGGIILATGLSAHGNIEMAEERARERAIALLLGNGKLVHTPAPMVEPVAPAPEPAPAPNPAPAPTKAAKKSSAKSAKKTAPPKPESAPIIEPEPLPEPEPTPPPVLAEIIPEPEPLPESLPEAMPETTLSVPDSPIAKEPELEPEPEMKESLAAPEVDSLPESTSDDLDEKFDFSYVSLQIQMQLERIKWDEKREAEYLQRMYGKKKRLVLQDGEMKEFLTYLETYAQTTVELNRVGWTNEQGSSYLREQYPESKGSRMLLKCSEIQEFLAHLQQQDAGIHEYI